MEQVQSKQIEQLESDLKIRKRMQEEERQMRVQEQEKVLLLEATIRDQKQLWERHKTQMEQ
jgi:hypothetical protein